jgi:DNA-binding transcriptional LysR family regulator
MNLPELWQLRYFVAVAERLHFGRAAAALHISQPPLSRAIRALEARLEVRLLERSRRRVELTPEGARLLEEARRAIAQLERTVLELRRMASGEQGRLRIGFVSLADYGVLPRLLKAYKATRPGVRLALREMLSPDQSAALAAGEPFVMVPREIAPGLYDIVTGLAARAGMTLNVAQEAIQMQTVVSLVSSGLGAAIVPASVANLGRRGVVYRELADSHPRLDLWLAWPRGTLSAAARDFLALARSSLPR